MAILTYRILNTQDVANTSMAPRAALIKACCPHPLPPPSTRKDAHNDLELTHLTFTSTAVWHPFFLWQSNTDKIINKKLKLHRQRHAYCFRSGAATTYWGGVPPLTLGTHTRIWEGLTLSSFLIHDKSVQRGGGSSLLVTFKSVTRKYKT